MIQDYNHVKSNIRILGETFETDKIQGGNLKLGVRGIKQPLGLKQDEYDHKRHTLLLWVYTSNTNLPISKKKLLAFRKKILLDTIIDPVSDENQKALWGQVR